MTHDHDESALSVGHGDAALAKLLEQGLEAFNFAATGTTPGDQGELSVKAVDERGDLIGGLTGWTWSGLFGIDLLWVREESRKGGWGSRLLRAAEAEARRRGCDRATVSSFTFQAPDFYRRHGYVETGRVPGIPGGAEDVYFFKSLRTEDGPGPTP
ncbi:MULTISPECIES: GNAT family N-acetyltransferase [Streptomyces]|uniref:GNAT family N-acetyltransferase n=1 Tax=Streptomyces TaxID=1883 RepID=UPI00093D8BCB|nr:MULTISPECIES: GNAT family N-acetyltransferase [Streptomyces]MBX9425824.1 GNAT family N-acetyltransferase [Streptomyces lateritius]OKJ69066.1 GCN5 family acetyltransferase [Streptomyces sp. CB02261]